jgi:hypothetical protein
MEENKSPWKKYKDLNKSSGILEAVNMPKESRPPRVTPLDLINPKSERSTDEKALARLEICKQCPELIFLTNQCKKCGCFMNLKTKLEKATCPLGKW